MSNPLRCAAPASQLAPLQDVLARCGAPLVPLSFPDGTRLLVLPRGARLLGLFTAESEANFLWTNPALAEHSQAAAYLQSAAWPNPGGDRTWLAPELGLFVADMARPGQTYKVPAAVDPGTWKVQTVGTAAAVLSLRTEVSLFRPSAQVRVAITRRCGPAPRPLSGGLPPGVTGAGYQQVTTLEVQPGPAGGPSVDLGLWHLLQLPQPGDMLVGTRAVTQPAIVFGPTTPQEFGSQPHLLRWRMQHAADTAKIAVKAALLSGRAGYLWQAAEGPWQLVVRQFGVDPAAEYVDALWDDPTETGFGFQACRVCAGPECFDEMEYHAPGVRNRAGANRCQEESCVWAFRGPERQIAQVADALLGAGAAQTGS